MLARCCESLPLQGGRSYGAKATTQESLVLWLQQADQDRSERMKQREAMGELISQYS